MAIGNINIRLLQNVNSDKIIKKKKVRLATDKQTDSYEKDLKKPASKPEGINVRYTPNESVDELNIAIVAADEIQAKDFLCGIYYDLQALIRTGGLSVYTRQHHTITMLTETKQYIERVITNPPGQKIKCTNSEVFSEYTLTLGQTANQKLSLNINFSCVSYNNVLKAGSADIVLIIINSSDGKTTQEKIASVNNSLRNRPVTWIFTGFARENIFYSSELDIAPSTAVRTSLKAKFSAGFKNGDTICYAQQYGGIVIEEHEGALPLYTPISECREYTPVACCLPLAYSLSNFKKSCDENRFAIHKICDILNTIVKASTDISPNWHEKHTMEVKS